MRFIPNGPSIPDELLAARDTDEVLFFCGAGVSQAEAYLPNFVDLVEEVLGLLGSAQDSPARRLFVAGKQSEKATKLTGLVATDRIFGLLEREFEPVEVREAVALALKPVKAYSLGAHRIMMDLARTRAGVARLVTTNFDLLFEECEPGIVSSNPPHLPDPRREKDFRGVIHLHGRVDEEYRRACDDEFVLSSADFGHAYLSDGWATRYFQTLLRRFRIVFVGYSADDPPVQYLLEALSRFEKNGHKVYAFQSGDATQAMAQWAHKGVVPIAYDSANGHAALWETLAAWAERARDVEAWQDRLIERASIGPALMAPYERGMIAHLASTVSGAKLLATANASPPAQWLSVFDCTIRYGDIEHINKYDEASSRFDPFDAFGLDSDVPPVAVDPDNIYVKRAVQQDAWNGVAVLPTDCVDVSSQGIAQLCGVYSDAASNLPPRLQHIGMWLVSVSHQPAALWWAAKQARLHPDIQKNIEWSLRQHADRYVTAVREGWLLLLAYWRQRNTDADYQRYEIEAKTNLQGWTPSLVRDFIALYQPRLSVKSVGVKAADPHPELSLKELLYVDVEYPRPHQSLEIPSELLGYAVMLFRQNLEHAVQIEREINGHDGLYFDTTRPDDGYSLDEDSHGLTGYLVIFTNLLARLTELNRTAARKEIAHWLELHDPLFTRLRIWAAGRQDLTTSEEAGQIFLDISDETFWSSRQERDLLFSLRDRWGDLSSSMINQLESRILESNIEWAEECENSEDLVTFLRLSRLHWLSRQGVKFSFDLDAVTEQRRVLAPTWTEESCENVARPNVSRAFSLEMDTDAAPLIGLPIGEVLGEALVLGQHSFISHVQRKPFYGFVAQRPARALSVLTDASRKDIFVQWAWSALLGMNNDKNMPTRLLSAIGCRLARLSTENLGEIVHPASAWLREHGARLNNEIPMVFDLVWNALVAAMMENSEQKRYPRPDRAWVNEGLNSPINYMLDSLLKDPEKLKFDPGACLPETLQKRFEQLLNLHGDHRRHAIAMISSRLNWLYQVDPCWTDDHLLSFVDIEGEDSSAFWAGYLWQVQIPPRSLYMKLKAGLIALARQRGQRRPDSSALAGILLAGWGNDKVPSGEGRLMTDIELREVLIYAEEDLRSHMLRHLQRWCLAEAELWGDRLMPFLTQVWPRQRDVRTSVISARLADLALAMPDRFPEIVEAILPKLASTSGAALRINPSLSTGPINIIAERHPRALLNLLWVVLGENTVTWPYGMEKLLSQLAEKTETQNDPKLAELRRRDQRR